MAAARSGGGGSASRAGARRQPRSDAVPERCLSGGILFILLSLSARIRWWPAAAAGGVAAGADGCRVGQRWPRHRVDARRGAVAGAEGGRRPLASPSPYGLQPFAVAPAPPSLSPAEMHAACDVRVAGLRALLVVEPAMRRCGPTHVRLRLSTLRPTQQLLASGWAQRPPVVRTVFTSEQRALLIELFEKRDRPNESQMFEIVNERFSYASDMYDMRLSRTQIKSFMSTEKARRKKAAAAGVVAAALRDGTLQAEDGDEGDDEGEGAEEDAVRRKTQQAPGTAAAAKVRCPTVEEMRKEAAALGWGAEASPAFAKGKKVVLAVLQRAQAAPRPVVAQAVQLGPEGSSGEEGGEEDEEEGEGEQVLVGSDVYVVTNINSLNPELRGGCAAGKAAARRCDRVLRPLEGLER